MIVLSQVLTAVTSIRYPHAGESLQDYMDTVCGSDKSALAKLDNIIGDEEPSKETIENFKLVVPFFGVAVEEIVNCVNEIKSTEDLSVMKWRGFAQSMKIVVLCLSDPDWVEVHKDMFETSPTV